MGRKKGGSGSKNGRDPNPKYLGVKVGGGSLVSAGTIIIRQRGTKIHPGENVGRGKDDTLFAKIDGTVVFNCRKNRHFASITPIEA